MNKKELIRAVAERIDVTQKLAEEMVEAVLDIITESLAKEEAVQLSGFGKFEVRHRAERKGRNPRTQEEMTIPATKAPAFKAFQNLKDQVK